MNISHLSKYILFTFSLIITGKTYSQEIEAGMNEQTGAITSIMIKNDSRKMNWMLATDNSQYQWIGKEYGWGLGHFTIVVDGVKSKNVWREPVDVQRNGNNLLSVYEAGDIKVKVSRRFTGGNMIEEYLFTNTANHTAALEDIGIHTPFNDNYPDAEICLTGRTNAHIWTGDYSAYVNAMHMSGQAPHLGLVLTKGSVKSYEILERDLGKSSSNARGVIVLNPENFTLEPGKSYTLAWQVFSHGGQQDFYEKIRKLGAVVGYSSKYVYEKGETAHIEFICNNKIKNLTLTVNGKKWTFKKDNHKIYADFPVNKVGELVFELQYDKKKTKVVCLSISGEKELIAKRAGFIVNRQQMNNPDDSRYGAYMVYDNEKDEIYLNDSKNSSLFDHDAGGERLGMGVFLSMQYRLTHDKKIYESLLKYAEFVKRLQDKQFNTWSNVEHNSRNRAYNYPWVANFYFEMFHVTGDKHYLSYGYNTLKAMFRNFGYGFYAIDIPTKGYELLTENGFEDESVSLLDDFKKIAGIYAKNGTNYPKHEVNYEQSIVAPSIIHLLRTYLLTKEQEYLDAAEIQLSALESFGGLQPDYHLNEISIRHWDGYWFGKREFFGDTFPHYWSVLTAVAYSLYAECTGNKSYQERAEKIVRHNLCLFFEDGKASCAFIYPNKVNGKNAHFYDPYANDQDWALVYYLMVCKRDKICK